MPQIRREKCSICEGCHMKVLVFTNSCIYLVFTILKKDNVDFNGKSLSLFCPLQIYVEKINDMALKNEWLFKNKETENKGNENIANKAKDSDQEKQCIITKWKTKMLCLINVALSVAAQYRQLDLRTSFCSIGRESVLNPRKVKAYMIDDA